MSLTGLIFVLGIVAFAIGFQLLDRIVRRMSKKKEASSKQRSHQHRNS